MNVFPGVVHDALRRTAVNAKLARRRLRRPTNLNVAPGTISVAPDALPPEVTVVAFGPDSLREARVTTVPEIDAAIGDAPVAWINIDGLGDAAFLKAIGERFGIHPLAMEDATDLSQRAKVDTYPAGTFIVLPMPHAAKGEFWTEQLALWVTDRFVVTFQSEPGDCLEQLRARIRNPASRLRSRSADYLAYAIADAVIDAYFPIVDSIGSLVEDLEEEVFRRPTGRQLSQIRRARAELIRMRRALLPIRDTASNLVALDGVFHPETRPYLRDLSDHVARALDQIETDRYMANDLLEIYMTSVNLKLGETSKVLTIIATIFLPLSFLTGLWGMNFEWLPLKDQERGFWFSIALMVATVAGMMLYFWRKGWLRDSTKQ